MRSIYKRIYDVLDTDIGSCDEPQKSKGENQNIFNHHPPKNISVIHFDAKSHYLLHSSPLVTISIIAGAIKASVELKEKTNLILTFFWVM
jgi:hypothetical protein